MKENVIIGKLIPAGTGMKRYRNIKLDSDINESTLPLIAASVRTFVVSWKEDVYKRQYPYFAHCSTFCFVQTPMLLALFQIHAFCVFSSHP